MHHDCPPKAAAGRRKRLLFQCHEEEQLFDELIQLTLRTELITQLTGLKMTSADKEEMDARLRDIARLRKAALEADPLRPGEAVDRPRRFVVTRPRGRGLGTENVNLLQPASKRLEATLLVALHRAGQGQGRHKSAAESGWAEALRWKISVYQEYLRLYRGCGQFTFEAYVVLIRGIEERSIELRACTSCGAVQPVHQYTMGPLRCPLCGGHENLGRIARQRVHRRLLAQRSTGDAAERRAYPACL